MVRYRSGSGECKNGFDRNERYIPEQKNQIFSYNILK